MHTKPDKIKKREIRQGEALTGNPKLQKLKDVGMIKILYDELEKNKGESSTQQENSEKKIDTEYKYDRYKYDYNLTKDEISKHFDERKMLIDIGISKIDHIKTIDADLRISQAQAKEDFESKKASIMRQELKIEEKSKDLTAQEQDLLEQGKEIVQQERELKKRSEVIQQWRKRYNKWVDSMGKRKNEGMKAIEEIKKRETELPEKNMNIEEEENLKSIIKRKRNWRTRILLS